LNFWLNLRSIQQDLRIYQISRHVLLPCNILGLVTVFEPGSYLIDKEGYIIVF